MSPEESIETRVALLNLALATQSDRLTKVETGIAGIQRSINRGLGAVCILLGGEVANLLITLSKAGK